MSKRTTFGERIVRHILLLALGFMAAGPSYAQIKLPDFGDSSSRVFSNARDRALGEAFMRQVRLKLDVSNDPEVQAYVDELGARLSTRSERGADGFKFFVIVADNINAFAGPGGHIGLHSGLITTTESEHELASVVAHEIAHVTQRHLARAYEQAEGLSIPVLAGLIAAVLVGSQNPEAGQAAAAAVLGASFQNQLDFSRAHELEADRVGMQLLHSAGFSVDAMPAFFERLQGASRYYRKPPEWLSTHPLTTSRISDSRARAEQYAQAPAQDSTLSYHLVRAKLMLIEEISAARAIEQFQSVLSTAKGHAKSGAQYGLALAFAASGQYARAESQLTELAQRHPGNPSIQSALGDTLAKTGRLSEALSVYADAQRQHPASAQVALGRAQLFLQNNDANGALEALRAYPKSKSSDMYRIEAQAYELKQQNTEAHMALAEFYYLDGDLDSAINQLKLAQSPPAEDFYTSSRVDARLRELEHEFAERAKE